MKNTARKKKLREAGLKLTLADLIRADLHEFVITAGIAGLDAVLEHERTRAHSHRGPSRRSDRPGPRRPRSLDPSFAGLCTSSTLWVAQ
jgi:hypothetical protein